MLHLRENVSQHTVPNNHTRPPITLRGHLNPSSSHIPVHSSPSLFLHPPRHLNPSSSLSPGLISPLFIIHLGQSSIIFCHSQPPSNLHNSIPSLSPTHSPLHSPPHSSPNSPPHSPPRPSISIPHSPPRSPPPFTTSFHLHPSLFTIHLDQSSIVSIAILNHLATSITPSLTSHHHVHSFPFLSIHSHTASLYTPFPQPLLPAKTQNASFRS